MAAYMRCNRHTGECRCTACGADVMWVKITQTGYWAGIVAVNDAETIVSEPYDGGKAGSGGKRNVATKVRPGATLHGCRDIVEKYGKAFAAFTAGQPQPRPTAPKAEPSPAVEPPMPTPEPDPIPAEPKAPVEPVVRCNQCGKYLDSKGQCVNPACALSHHEPLTPPVEPKAEPSPAPEPKADPANPLAGLQAWIEQLAQSSMDKDAVQSMIDKALAEIQEQIKDLEPQTKTVERIIVERANGSKVVIEGHQHPMLKDLLDFAYARKHVFMPGPSGAGKSYMAAQIAEILGVPYYEILMGPADTPGKIVGFHDAMGNIVSTEFRKAWTGGGLIHIEEIANGNAAALVTINAALANGHATFPDGRMQKHPDFICFASDNTWGLGPTPSFPTRRPLDGANRDRFHFVEVGYDVDFEASVAVSRANGNADLALGWHGWVLKVREWAKDNAPSLLVTPRATFEGIDDLMRGVPEWRTAEEHMLFIAKAVLFKTPDEDLIQRIVTACPLPAIKVEPRG